MNMISRLMQSILIIIFIINIVSCNNNAEKTEQFEYLYYDNGQVMLEIPRKNGEIEGLYKRYKYNGDLELEVLIGSNTKGYGFLYDSSKVVNEGMYKVHERDLDEEIIGEQKTHKIVPTGLHKVYYPSGELMSYINYNDNGWRTGKCIELFKNGVIKSNENYKDGFKDGICFFYNSNGELEKKEVYKKGKLIK